MKSTKYIFALVLAITILAVYFIHNTRDIIHDYRAQIDLLTDHSQLITNDNQILLCEVEVLRATMDSLPLGSPIYDTLIISSSYGVRRNPFGIGWGFHSGIDIFAAWSDTVQASGDGVVLKANWFGGYGRCITIKHAGGYVSYYAHLYRIFVEEGDAIKKGQPIGRAGNSGAVTGPHLHYEIRRGSESADPLEYIR